ncbi:branched-chain amino acid ABC transporter permease [Haloplanus pelagicus]|jgi:branched-chain amino acid transport system permease protein|uniref:branched-chain amino acid ABC transporter permease n=1 Tax=Haloplanus pelagicus TaxID=2949995 RepID=UPI0020420FB6|nr:branched-chain amino acid ABC transporter permease [Haloplanus sp. HW8-1]
MVQADLLVQIVIFGILTGGVYALIAMGLSLIFGVMDVVNFAHGAYLMLAMYSSYFAWSILGIDPFLSILLVAPTFFVFGVISERLVIHPIIDEPDFAQIFATVGLIWVFENTAHYFWGADPRGISSGYGGVTVLGVTVQEVRVYGFVIAVLAAVGMYFLLEKTKIGLAIRATAQDKDAAKLMGMSSEKVYMITFGLGIGLVGIAGPVVATIFSTTPTVGANYVLLAFVVVVLGGLGNVFGVLWAGILIGIVDAMVAFYYEPTLSAPVYYVIFIAVLVFRAMGYIGEDGSIITRIKSAATGSGEA